MSEMFEEEPIHPDKGKQRGRCNRRACQSPDDVVWYNTVELAWYCESCAAEINEHAVRSGLAPFIHREVQPAPPARDPLSQLALWEVLARQVVIEAGRSAKLAVVVDGRVACEWDPEPFFDAMRAIREELMGARKTPRTKKT